MRLFQSPHFLATSNFVSPDYFSFSANLVEACRKAGARTFALLLGSASIPSLASSQLRIAGAAKALGESIGRTTHLLIEATESMSERSGYKAAKAVFEGSGQRPDLLYCGGDFLALGALRYLDEAGIRVPDEVMVVGGSGMHTRESTRANLSMMEQSLEALGKRAVRMLIHRINASNIAVPGEFEPCRFLEGRTTTVAVNRHLADLAQAAS